MIFAIGPHKPEIHPTAFVHPSAEVSGKVRIGPYASIWGQCVLRGDVDWIDIGADCNLQDGTIVHTSHGIPVKLEKGVTVGHRALLHGTTVGAYSLIGMGAILLDSSVVEDHCMIGAGALVKEKGRIPTGSLALGIPAKPIRSLSADETKMIIDRAKEYIDLAETYKLAVSSLK